MSDNASAWNRFIPHPGIDFRGPAGAPVRVGPEADNQLALQLRDGPTLFISFDRSEDPSAPGTTVELTMDWTRVPGPPAPGITPLVVAWTPGGGVLQLAPEQPDDAEVAPGARILGGPELVLNVPPTQVPTWIGRLLALPRRSVLDPRREQTVWLGAVDEHGRLVLQRMVHTGHDIVLEPAGTADPDRLAPPWALGHLDPLLRARRAGSTRVYGRSGEHLSADLFAIEADVGVDGVDLSPARLRAAADRRAPMDGTSALPIWRWTDGGIRRWITLHESRQTCPIPLEVPELDGAAGWVECGESPSPAAPRPPADPATGGRRRRFWRR